jgi:hypothetical protein
MELGVTMLWESETTFTADVIGPFGGLAATIAGSPSGGTLSVGGKQVALTAQQPIRELVDFGDVDITFGDFVRILTGGYLRSLSPEGIPDTVEKARRLVRLRWATGSTVTDVVARRSDCMAVSVECRRPDSSWVLRFEEFASGVPGRTTFRVDDRNYFVLARNAHR